MKKRILSLVMAVLMIVSLLPVTALAAAPSRVSVRLLTDKTWNVCDVLRMDDGGTAQYAKTVNGDYEMTDANEDNYNMKFEYKNGLLDVTFRNVNLTEAFSGQPVVNFWDAGDYAIRINLVGRNVISNAKGAGIAWDVSGGMTITGGGSLEITNNGVGVIHAKNGDLTIKDTTVTVTNSQTYEDYYGIMVYNGNLTINNANVTVNSPSSTVFFGSGHRVENESQNYGLYIENGSNVKMETVSCGWTTAGRPTIAVHGEFVIDSSYVEIGDIYGARAAYYTPKIVGDIAAEYKGYQGGTYVPLDMAAGTPIENRRWYDDGIAYIRTIEPPVVVTWPNQVKFRFKTNGCDATPIVTDGGEPIYAKTVNGEFVFDGASASEYNIKMSYNNGIVDVEFNNVNVSSYWGNYRIINFSYEATDDNFDYAIRLTLVGENIFNTPSDRLGWDATGGMTITGDGSLSFTTAGACVLEANGGDLTIENATVNLVNTAGSDHHGIMMKQGNLIIDNAKVNINTPGAPVFFGSDNRVRYEGTDRGVTIQNESNVVLIHNTAWGNMGNAVITCYGPVVIDNSNVELNHQVEAIGALYNAPTLIGVNAKYRKYTSWDWYTFNAEAGTPLDINYRFMKITTICKHENAGDDGDCTSAVVCTDCGETIVAAQPDHAWTDDTDADCNNEGCNGTRVVITWPRQVKFRFKTNGCDATPTVTDGGEPIYAKTVNGEFVFDGASASEYNIKMSYNNGIVDVEFNNVNVSSYWGNYRIINFSYEATDDNFDYAIRLTLVGENIFNTPSDRLGWDATGGMTITGNGSLSFTTAGAYVLEANGGDLTIENATVNLVNTAAYDYYGIMMSQGNLIIDNADVNINAAGPAVWFGNGHRVAYEGTDRGVTIRNGANVVMTYNTAWGNMNYPVVACYGPVVIDSSNVELNHRVGATGAGSVGALYNAPSITGDVTAKYKLYDGDPWVAFAKNPGEPLDRFYSTFHVTINPACDHDALTDDDDCTTAVVCPVCGEDVVAATSHVAEKDDGDCTTAVKCANCAQIAVPANDHAWTDDNDTTCDNAGCEATRIPAKAVAVLNGVYYNTLAEAVAAADNGDTVTMLKNSSGDGMVIRKSITIDFGGFIYTVNSGVGDVPSNGLQIRKEAGAVILKNGRLQANAKQAAMFYTLIQNYADLTLEDMVLKGENLDKWSGTDGDSYTLSINSGNVVIKGNSTITANDEGAYAYALDAFDKPEYEGVPTVTVEAGVKVYGAVEVTGGNLVVGATISKPLVYTSGTVTLVDGGSIGVPAGYIFVDGVLTPDTTNAVARIGNRYFKTLADAYEAAVNGDEIVLLKNVTGAGIVIKKSITIDFGGYIYTFNAGVGDVPSNGLQIRKEAGEVTLKNGRLQISANSKNQFYTLIQNYANLTIEDMVLKGENLDKWSGTDGDSYVVSINSGNVTIKGATSIYANDEGAYAYALDAFDKPEYEGVPTVTIEAGVKVYGAVEVTGGNLVVGATISKPLVYTSGTVTLVDGGWIKAPVGYYYDNNVLTVDHRKAVVRIGDNYFNTMADAYDAAGDGDTLVLLKGISDRGLLIEKNITIDFAGYIWTAKYPISGTTCVLKIAEGKEVTLKSTGATGRLQNNASEEMIGRFDTLVYNEGTLNLDNMKLNGLNLMRGDTSYTVYNAGEVSYVNSMVVKNTNIAHGYSTYYA